MAKSKPVPRRSVATTWHRVAGWAWYRIGDWERARAHFERVLELAGEDFDALVRLGRVAYKLGEYAEWKRDCGRARRVDPERYGRLKHPFELFEPRVDHVDEDVLPLSNNKPVALRASRAGESPNASTDSRSESDSTRGRHHRRAADGDRRDSSAVGDDFSSATERERFADLAPIDANAVADIDFDELARRLIG